MVENKQTKFQISLAAARVNAGLTQVEAAEKAHVSNKTINNWENGKVSPSFANVENIWFFIRLYFFAYKVHLK